MKLKFLPAFLISLGIMQLPAIIVAVVVLYFDPNDIDGTVDVLFAWGLFSLFFVWLPFQMLYHKDAYLSKEDRAAKDEEDRQRDPARSDIDDPLIYYVELRRKNERGQYYRQYLTGDDAKRWGLKQSNLWKYLRNKKFEEEYRLNFDKYPVQWHYEVLDQR